MRRRLIKPITHVPTSMNNAPAAATAIVVFAGVAARLAGLSITGNTTDEDRDREIAIGRKVHPITFNINVVQATAATMLEYAVFKVERADTTPALGTLLPTSAEITSEGLQQAMRREQPGRVVKYGAIALSPETTRTHVVRADFSKFKLGFTRQGDHYGIVIYQRLGNTGTVFDVQMRYKTSG